jgi:hypothetical protein
MLNTQVILAFVLPESVPLTILIILQVKLPLLVEFIIDFIFEEYEDDEVSGKFI